MSLSLPSGRQSAVQSADGSRIGTTTKLSSATGENINSLISPWFYCNFRNCISDARSPSTKSATVPETFATLLPGSAEPVRLLTSNGNAAFAL